MKNYKTISKLSIILISTMVTNNLLAISWNLPSFNLPPIVHTLANLTRPQLNIEWISKLPSYWSSLSPAQRNIVLSIALVGLGAPGIIYQYVRQQQAPQAIAKANEETLEIFLRRIDEIEKAVDETDQLDYLNRLLQSLNQLAGSLHTNAQYLNREDYESTHRTIQKLADKIEDKIKSLKKAN